MHDKNENANGGIAVELRPTQYLEAHVEHVTNRREDEQVALIILNSPIADLERARTLYNHASFRICADGGANRVHDLLLAQYGESHWKSMLQIMLPDLILGDLDSLRPSVRKRYEQLGVEVLQDHDQYSTDFGKAVNKVVERVPHGRDVLILGSLGGRVDQGVGLLHELYREQKRHPSVRFWFFSEESVSVLLRPGSTLIYTPLKDGLITRNVGILPLYGPACVTTNGLEWDVSDWPTEMGGQVSTSNHIVADQVTITTDHDVLFTVELGLDI